jgi:hypothetical protein
MHSITCGKCHETHYTVAQVKACHDGDLRKGEQYIHGQYVGYVGCGDPDEPDAADYDGPRTVFYVGDQHPCEAHVMIHTEDGPASAPCGAPRVLIRPGEDRCHAGHGYVDMETRAREGWEYAECAEEAKALAKAGVDPRDATGSPWVF